MAIEPSNTVFVEDTAGLHKTQTAVTMSAELFQKLYLTPKVPRAGDFNNRFANPTPLGCMGFVIATFTYSMILMEVGGVTSFSPVLGIFFFVGPVLLLLGVIFEWVMGNFFPMMVQGLFAVFWLSFGLLQIPHFGLASSYANSEDPTGTSSPEFNITIALYLIVWTGALLTFFVFTLKINVVFAAMFLLCFISTALLSAAYFKLSEGDTDAAGTLKKSGGALFFVVSVLGWYLIIVIMAAELRMGIQLPVGDLTRLWPQTDFELTET